MTQQEVYNLLTKKDKWMTAKEISQHLKISNANPNLLRLFKRGDVKRKQVKLNNTLQFLWSIK